MNQDNQTKLTKSVQSLWRLSDKALHVYSRLGTGSLLRVPHDGSGAILMPYNPANITPPQQLMGNAIKVEALQKSPPSQPGEPVRKQVFKELRESGLIYKLTPDGDPPVSQRKNVTSWRMGWREMNLPGETSDWYVCTM